MFVLQSPEEKLDWHQDWSDWMQDDDAIASSDWEIHPAATLTDEAVGVTADMTSVKVEGLTLGVTYELKNTITTVNGLLGSRDIIIRCAES